MPTVADSPMQVTVGLLRELVRTTPVGARLPGERDLAKKWHVARMTLRRATDVLAAEGLVDRRHGSGTYVLPRPCVRILGLTSFTRDMRQRGMVPSTTVIAFNYGSADDEIAAALAVPVGTDIVYFTRLRRADDAPMAVETVWLPTEVVPNLRSSELSGSFYSLLERRYQCAPVSARVNIEPALPPEPVRDSLATGPSDPCLRIRVTSSGLRGQIFMYSIGYYRGDRYQLQAELLAGSFAGADRTAR